MSRFLISWTEEMDEWETSCQRNQDLCPLPLAVGLGDKEFHAAAASGQQPELVFIVHAYEYNNERQVEYEGKYDVIVTYRPAMRRWSLFVGGDRQWLEREY